MVKSLSRKIASISQIAFAGTFLFGAAPTLAAPSLVKLPEYCDCSDPAEVERDSTLPENQSADKKEVAVFDKYWYLSLVPLPGESSKDAMKRAGEQLFDAAVASLVVAAPYLAPFVGAFKSQIFSFGSSNASVDQNKIILDALDKLERNIKLELGEVVAQETEADFEALKYAIADYYRFKELDERIAMSVELANMYLEIGRIRNVLEINAVENFDYYHVYLSVVSLELQIVAEELAIKKIMGSPNSTDEEIRILIEGALQDRLDDILTYTGNLDWQAKFSSLFTDPQIIKGQSLAGSGFSENDYRFRDRMMEGLERAIRDYAGPFSMAELQELEAYFKGDPDAFQTNWSDDELSYKYKYEIDNNTYNLIVQKSDIFGFQPPFRGQRLSNELSVIWIEDEQGKVLFFYPYLLASSELSRDRSLVRRVFFPNNASAIKNAVSKHMNYIPELMQFLHASYTPSASIMDTWWKTAGYEGLRPRNHWDLLIESAQTDAPDIGFFASRGTLEGVFQSVKTPTLSEGSSWLLQKGPTPTGQTGPKAGPEGEQYAYFETSEGFANLEGDKSVLSFEINDMSDNWGISKFTLSFDYFMYGDDIGTLQLLRYDGESETPIPVWERIGSIQASSTDDWATAVIPVNAAAETVRFEIVATAKGGDAGDIAITRLKLKRGY